MSQVADKAAEIREVMELGEAPAMEEVEAAPPPRPRLASVEESDETPIDDAAKPHPQPGARTLKRPTPRPTQRSSKLGRFLPDGERVKVWKRDLGQRRYVRHYTMPDLAHAQDIETFLQTYVVPAFGEGEYDIEVIGSDGSITRTLTLSVLDPHKAAPVAAGGVGASPLIERLLDRIEALERESRKPAKTMLEQIQEVSQIQQLMGGDDDKPRAELGTIATLMMAMQQQPAPITGELAELKAQLRELSRPAPASLPELPSAPPPAVDIAALLRELAAITKPAVDPHELVERMKQDRTQMMQVAMQLVPIVERMLGNRSEEVERMRSQQMQLLQEQLREAKATPARGLRETLEEMAVLRQFMGPARSAGASQESFWSFLSKVVDQFPATMESLSGVVEKIRQEQQPTPALKARPAPTPKPRPTAPSSKATQPPPKPTINQLASHLAAIETAPDDASLVEATLKAFHVLGQSEPWRAHLVKAMTVAKQGNRDEALRWIRGFLDGLVDAKRLSAEARDRAAKAFETHIDKVIDALKDKR